MRERQTHRDRLRAQEFEAFVAGAGGRLLHTATLLTAEPTAPAGANVRAERLLCAALARTYAEWDRLRGEDPYDRTRQELAVRFAREAWRHRHPLGGVLGRLAPLERLVLVLRLYEEVGEDQTAALLGLPADRIRAVCDRSIAAMRSPGPRHPAAGSALASGVTP
ncbi:RNA polymerase [Streptomyces microflavus]|uniref:RNA polymerase ECF-subfamily sigma factor n=1 Tax=Streptomyces microflavus DSM 40593 TaxID=1303692 RepID=N0CTX8_STRMI|nr:RNA polymerase ECF-subfamily sigma factor [Streptomyces microflavus]AGK79651.1 RNA polymerase ECF-subfamily sigma factor [Streptomyces microflavus DSM 40593]MCX4654807.1 RNA polymerase [Streptomyces microflavus]WSA62924.1 RNA polymerase [Streptomyces microflavus]